MMQTQNALIQRLSRYARFSTEELDCLRHLQASPERVEESSELIYEGQTTPPAYTLLEGWAFSYKLLPDGGRQVVTFLMPGDFMGLRSVLLQTSDHSVATFTDCVVSSISVKRLATAFNDYPRVGMAVLWAISRDEAIVVEHLVNIGRRSAIERTAHFFLELGVRLHLAGLASESSFEFPFNQYLLSDALGLSAIHVNRVLRALRERGLITLRQHHVVITDIAGLIELAGFDSDYLEQKTSFADGA